MPELVPAMPLTPDTPKYKYGMPEWEATIAVRVFAADDEEAAAKLAKLIKVSYRIKYMIEVTEDA